MIIGACIALALLGLIVFLMRETYEPSYHYNHSTSKWCEDCGQPYALIGNSETIWWEPVDSQFVHDPKCACHKHNRRGN